MVAADPRPSAGGFTACLSGLRQVKDDRRTAEDFATSNWCNRATEAYRGEIMDRYRLAQQLGPTIIFALQLLSYGTVVEI